MLIKLNSQIGFGWTVRIMGFIVLVTMLMALALTRLRSSSSKKRTLINLNHFRDLPYLLICLGFLVGFLGLYVFYYYIQLYAIDQAGNDPELDFYLLPILNAGSFFGRILPNYAADKLGPTNT